jgi:uncharacterized protein YifE (UPF0438 family)
MDTTNLPPDHREHLQRRPFRFGCETDIFPVDELGALSERGHWMEALVAGTIVPLTAEHEHFLHVDRDEAEPTTVDERAWLRLKGRREYEREQQSAPRPEPKEDYGIIDWDREKCWW